MSDTTGDTDECILAILCGTGFASEMGRGRLLPELVYPMRFAAIALAKPNIVRENFREILTCAPFESVA